MPTGLIRRGARYSIRRRIPVPLLPQYGGKKEIVRALGTADPRTARKLLPLVWAALTQEFEEAEQRAAASVASATQHPIPAATKGALDPWSTMSRERWDYEMESMALDYAETSQMEFEREERAPIEAAILATLKDPGASLSSELLAFRDVLRDRDFAVEIAEDRANAARREAKLASVSSGEGEAGLPVRTPPVHNSRSLDSIVDRWAAERKVSPKGVDAHRAVARWFSERTSKDDVSIISKRDVISFKDKLLAEGASLANVKVKLSRLRTLLNYASANDLIASNPAKDVQIVVTDADKTRRKPFDLASLTAIFSSPIYSEDARPTEGRGEAAYWLPLLALFTGARLEELGQLRPSDVREEPYADADEVVKTGWFIHVVEDAEDGLKLKNAGSERIIPVHPSLISQGFIQFAQAAGRANQARLFPELRPDKYGRLTAKRGEWFGEYKRNVIGITDGRLVFHSFRHTFADKGRSRMSEGVKRQIMGHSSSDVADKYGSGHEVWQLVAGIQEFRVPGLRLPKPPPSQRT